LFQFDALIFSVSSKNSAVPQYIISVCRDYDCQVYARHAGAISGLNRIVAFACYDVLEHAQVRFNWFVIVLWAVFFDFLA